MAQLEEVTVDQYKHLVSERALTGETMLLNMGPQHPSTHGVLRLLLELDGETVINCIPDIGYLHTGVEKNMEAKTYQKAEVMTDRLDYMNLARKARKYRLFVGTYCEAVKEAKVYYRAGLGFQPSLVLDQKIDPQVFVMRLIL